METVTAHDTIVQIDRDRNRFVLQSPDGFRTTYPFVPMGSLVSAEQVSLAREGLPPDVREAMEADTFSLLGGGEARVGYGMVEGATVIAPGVAHGISIITSLSSTSEHYWVLGRPTVVAGPSSFDGLLAVTLDINRFLSRNGHGFEVLHLDEGRLVRIATHRTADGQFAFDRELRFVVTTIADGTVIVSDAATGACAATTQVPDKRLRGVTLSDDGEHVAFRGVERSWGWRWRSEQSAAPVGPAAPAGPERLWPGLVSKSFTRR